MPAGLHCLLVGAIDCWQDAIVHSRRHGMVGSVTGVQSHDQSKGGRSVTGVHGNVTEVQNKSIITEDMEKRVGTDA